MSELFGNNYFFLYIFACITIFNYSTFRENQKISILYFITFGLGFLKIFNIFTVILFLITSTFLFLEILSSDALKSNIIIKMRYKVLDYLFLIIFQYNILSVILSVILTSIRLTHHISATFNLPFQSVKLVLQFFSIVLFINAIVKMTSEKFKIKTIDEIMKSFDFSINMVPFNSIDTDIFNMLIDMEDRTYRVRKKTYSFLSFEFLKYKINRQQTLNYQKVKKYLKATKHIRGYSTLEMQLMRTIGITYGYNMIYTRKIYELIYSTVFLKSLNQYYHKNIYANKDRYKDYLLYIYLQSVNTQIGHIFYPKVTDFIGPNIKDCTKEKCFIAFSGLTHPKVPLSSKNILYTHPDIVKKYKLDKEQIQSIMIDIENS